jgi:hypothetical protein
MKTLKFIFVSALLFAIQSLSAQAITDKWKAMNDYHTLLFTSLKSAEVGNFKEIKSNADELLKRADLLEVTTMPQDLRNSQVEHAILLLKNQTKLVDDLVKNKAPNAEIMRAFQNLYDIYNRVALLSESRR